MPGSKNTEYRLLSNWLPTGTCWVEIAFRSAWIAAWLIVSLNTHTFGPNTAEAASGHKLGAGAAGAAGADEAATAAVAGTAASEPAASAATMTRDRTTTRMDAPHCAQNGTQQECNPLSFLWHYVRIIYIFFISRPACPPARAPGQRCP